MESRYFTINMTAQEYYSRYGLSLFRSFTSSTYSTLTRDQKLHTIQTVLIDEFGLFHRQWEIMVERFRYDLLLLDMFYHMCSRKRTRALTTYLNYTVFAEILHAR